MEKKNQVLIPQGWARAAVFTIILVVVSYLATLFLTINADTSEEAGGGEQSMSEYSLFVLFIISGIISTMLVFLFRKFIDRKSFYSLGLKFKTYEPDALTGLFLSAAILFTGTYFLFLNGNISWIDITVDASSLFTSLILMAVIAISEELVFRGYILNNLMESCNKFVALIITSTIFTLFHINNPNVSIIGVLGIYTGGLLLGINYIYTKNLWYAIFFHFAWNLMQGPILGYPVSGISLEPLLTQESKGNIILTGGSFGFEGSMVSVVLCLLAALVLMLVYERKQKPLKVRKRKR